MCTTQISKALFQHDVDFALCTYHNVLHHNLRLLLSYSLRLNLSQIDELGNWCLKGKRGAKRHKLKRGIIGNPGSGNHPKKQLLTDTVTLKGISGNNLPDPLLTERPANPEGGRREREQESLAQACSAVKHLSPAKIP